MKSSDLKHPFFRPLWRRIAIVVICLAWASFEMVNGSSIWGLVFASMGLYCAWQFFIVFYSVQNTPSEDSDEPPSET